MQNQLNEVYAGDFCLYIEDLKLKNLLSERAYKICKKYKLYAIDDIINFYNYNKSFLKLRNCGIKTENELILLCKTYKNKIAYQMPMTMDILNINYSIEDLKITEGISEKTKDVCYSENLFSLKDIIEYYRTHKSFENIKNCTIETYNELQNLIKKNIFDLIGNNNFNKFTKIQNDIEQKFKLDFTKHYPNFEIDFRNDSICLFRLIDNILSNAQCFNFIEKRILRTLYIGNENSMCEIAKNSRLTNEGVRFKMIKLSEKFFDNEKSFIKYLIVFLKGHFDFSYLKFYKPYLVINNNMISQINNKCNTSFSNYFMIHILRFIYDTYDLSGDINILLNKKNLFTKKCLKLGLKTHFLIKKADKEKKNIFN